MNFLCGGQTVKRTRIFEEKPQLKCPRHSSVLTSFCKQCVKEMCRHCRCSESHEIIALEKLEGQYRIDYKTLKEEFLSLKGKCDFHSLPMEDEATEEESYRTLEKAQTGILSFIESYFGEIAELYGKISGRGRSRDWLANIHSEISAFENELSLVNGPTNFYSQQFSKKLKILGEEISKSSVSHRFSPHFLISPGEFLAISLSLGQYTSIVPSSTNVYNSMRNVRITAVNTFLPEIEPVVAIPNFSREEVLVHRLSNSFSEKFHLALDDGEFCEESCTLTIPNGDLYVIGGIVDGRIISNQVLKSSLFSLSDNSFEEPAFKELKFSLCSPMKVPRVGHSTVFHKGYIYVIGGNTNNSTKTQSCERYEISQNRWETIAELNIARSRAALCSFGNSSLYAFFGTTENRMSTMKVEKYEEENNFWILLSLCNLPSVFAVSFASAIQINTEQILVFGGCYEGEGEQIIPSRRAILFSPKEEIYFSLGEMLPMAFLASQNPFISQKHIYALSFCPKSMKPFTRVLDSEFLFSVKNDNKAEIQEVLHF